MAQNRSGSLEKKCRITRMEVDSIKFFFFIKFDFVTGGQEIKVSMLVNF